MRPTPPPHRRARHAAVFLGLLGAAPATLPAQAPAAAAPAAPAAGIEFFEKKIRPVLVEHCYRCHSARAEKLKGGLMLDSRPGWEAGGESGPVIVPGDPGRSVILSALRYEKFEMPPKAKLPDGVVADFEDWIAMGAPDPRSEKTVPAPRAVEVFDLDGRKRWWSLQPVGDPAVPAVSNTAWPRADTDRFILAALESKGWQPAPAAEKHSWLRRVTYDLTGLPPTPGEVDAFLADDDPGAHGRVVDRLLGSAHFGEQWARHWMDLVRYAETKAFEADYAMPNVFHYRDYLIRAFNAEIPYDQLLREAVAGDLIEPRVNPETGVVESVIGPGYLYLTDGQHGPPDIHSDEARIFDDMIDVVGKAFLAQTLACARCHDHKFDAITTADYYSLYGILGSSRIDYADINPPARQAELRGRLREQKTDLRRALADVLATDLSAEQVAADLRAVRAGAPETARQVRWAEALAKKPNAIARAVAELLTAGDTAAIGAAWERLRGAGAGAGTGRPRDLAGLTRTGFGGWLASGRAFGDAPRPPGDFIVTPEGDNPVATFVGGRPAAGHLGSRFAGSLKSPTFQIGGGSVTVRVKGKNLRVSLYVRHYELVGKGPTTKGTTQVINGDTWQTVRFGTGLWVGEDAYIEVQHNGGEINFKWGADKHVDGAYAVLDAAVDNRPLPPLRPAAPALGITGRAPDTPDGIIDHLAARAGGLAAAWRDGALSPAQGDLLEALHGAGVLDFDLGRSAPLRAAVESFRQLQREIPPPTYVRSLTDGPGEDEPVYIRGSHKNPSRAPNPRRFLDGIDGTPFEEPGSGRREWAEALVAEGNPLTARVAVNRVWHHLTGRGIVASVDDFGHMGDRPSHPALLDFLAREFVADGWSVKRLVRRLVLSSTYRMSSRADPRALREDPGNVYLQHMPVRRLQAEAVRDTLLAVSGALDPALYGPSQGGDGGVRRSVYIQLRRRYMPEFLMTFDMPNATETFGRRNITAGPAQSLALLNSDFAWRAAERWQQRLLRAGDLPFAQRVDLLHRQAFGRAAAGRDIEWARDVLRDHGLDEHAAAHHGEFWKQLCHTMLNRKELIYLY